MAMGVCASSDCDSSFKQKFGSKSQVGCEKDLHAFSFEWWPVMVCGHFSQQPRNAFVKFSSASYCKSVVSTLSTQFERFSLDVACGHLSIPFEKFASVPVSLRSADYYPVL